MAFSGGGSRATALALTVLQQLRNATYTIDGKPTNLLENVQLISSVSGGSVTAGYVAMNGLDRIDKLTDDFLMEDNMAALEWSFANPVTWLGLTFGNESRIDVLRDLFDERMFHQAAFGEVRKKNHPIVIFNATDMVSGEVFAFTPDRFDDICSDLDTVPLSVVVASSAAFPVLLSPVDLKNYSAGCKMTAPAPAWIDKDLNSENTRYLNVKEYKRARYVDSLRRAGKTSDNLPADEKPFRNIEYIHLLDGGVADNQGIGSLADMFFFPHASVRLLDAINRGKWKKIVVITVNARSDLPSELDQYAGTPGIISMLKSVTSVPIDSATASLNGEMQNLLDTLRANVQGIAVYGITIDFDQFRKGQESFRDDVKKIGTTWTLTSGELKTVNDAGTILLHQHPCFQRLLMDLNAKGEVDPDFAKRDCPVSN